MKIQSQNFNTLRNASCLLVTLFFMFNLNYLVSQTEILNKKHYGFSIESNISGNTHGITYASMFNMGIGRRNFSIGPVAQKRTLNIEGFKLAYSYELCGPSTIRKNKAKLNSDQSLILNVENLESLENGFGENFQDESFRLNVFSFAQYLHKAPLSYSAQKLEQHTNRIEGMNWAGVKLSTIDVGAGIELRLKLYKNLIWKNTLATVLVYHTNYINNMHHENLIPTIHLGTAIEFSSI